MRSGRVGVGLIVFKGLVKGVSMSTYAELMAQAEDLRRQAEERRRQEVAEVIADIRAKMAQYGITVEELTGRKGRKGSSKPKGEPKYRGPNGELWSGGPGRKPQWVRQLLAQGGDIEQYRIAA